jgi:hypothetical protein
VSSYSITITTDEATNASTTLHANVGANGRILELTVRANGPEGFTPEELPAFDLRRLISAVILAVPGSPVIDAAPVASALPAVDYQAAPAARKAAGGRAARKANGRKAAGRGAARKAATRETSGERQSGARGGRRAAKATAKAAAAKSDRETRAYRRMPDDVVAVFQQAGGVTRTAEHYGVPRHTAQGWIRRLRMQGDLPA